MKVYGLVLLFLAWSTLAAAQEPVVQRIVKQYDAARPADKALAFYSLDWAPNLAEAKVRARAEGRPIFFLYLTNITAATDFFAGHC